jgi:hypothetical protein
VLGLVTLQRAGIVEMKRIYDSESRTVLAQFFTNAAKLAQRGHLNDPGDLGSVIGWVKRLGVMLEGDSVEMDDTETWIAEQELSPSLSLGRELLKKTNLDAKEVDTHQSLQFRERANAKEADNNADDELTDEEKEADELIGRVMRERMAIVSKSDEDRELCTLHILVDDKQPSK